VIVRSGPDGQEVRGYAPHASQLHQEAGPVLDAEPVVDDTSEEAPVARKSRVGARVAWFMGLAGAGVVIGLAISMGMKFIDGPVNAKPPVSLAVLQSSPTPTPPAGELSGLYIDIKYPSIFDSVSQIKNDANSLESYVISSSSDYRRTIAVSVRKLPSGNIADDSSYKFREISPETYTQLPQKAPDGSVMYLMKKTDNSEQSLFWVHKTMDLNVSVTSSNAKDDLGAYMALIMPRLVWKQ
jgi:hypothetical protein